MLAADIESAPVSGTRAARYQVVLHVEPDTLRKEDQISRFRRELLAMEEEPPDDRLGAGTVVDPSEADDSSEAKPRKPTTRSHLQDGPYVSAETSRRISCDCGVVRVEHDHPGSILSVGRKTRSISPALRRALETRDQGCRFPGCGHRFADAHHVKHWADGGETSLDNTVLLCSYHHRLVHEGGWTVDWWGKGRPAFTDPRGHLHFEGGWQPTRDAANNRLEKDTNRPPAAETLLRENLARGIKPDAYTASARWKREVDIPGEISGPAEEALL